MSGTSIIPSVKSDNVLVESLQDELLIYDLSNDQASCLNPTAALVWKYADGKHTVSEIAAQMSNELGSSVDTRVVLYALEQLDRKHLLSAPLDSSHSSNRLTRRDFLVKAGVVGAAVAIPVIISIAAPSPAMAATCRASGQPCSPAGANAQCCSGNCQGNLQCA